MYQYMILRPVAVDHSVTCADTPTAIAVFSPAFFRVAGRHAMNLGCYAVLQAAMLSFEQRGG